MKSPFQKAIILFLVFVNFPSFSRFTCHGKEFKTWIWFFSTIPIFWINKEKVCKSCNRNCSSSKMANKNSSAILVIRSRPLFLLLQENIFIFQNHYSQCKPIPSYKKEFDSKVAEVGHTKSYNIFKYYVHTHIYADEFFWSICSNCLNLETLLDSTHNLPSKDSQSWSTNSSHQTRMHTHAHT